VSGDKQNYVCNSKPFFMWERSWLYERNPPRSIQYFWCKWGKSDQPYLDALCERRKYSKTHCPPAFWRRFSGERAWRERNRNRAWSKSPQLLHRKCRNQLSRKKEKPPRARGPMLF